MKRRRDRRTGGSKYEPAVIHGSFLFSSSGSNHPLVLRARAIAATSFVGGGRCNAFTGSVLRRTSGPGPTGTWALQPPRLAPRR